MKSNLGLILFLFALIYSTTARKSAPVINEQALDNVKLFNATQKNITISCDVSGGDVYPIYYTWEKNELNVTADDVNNVTGTLTIANPADNDTYQCFASNEWGLAVSKSVVLHVLPIPSPIPDSEKVNEDQPFKINCNVSMDLVKNIDNRWTLKGKNVSLADEDDKIVDSNGSLWFSKAEASNNKSIYVYQLRYENDWSTVCEIEVELQNATQPFNSTDSKNNFVSGRNETAELDKNKKLYCMYFNGNSSDNITTNWTKSDGTNLTSMVRKSGKYLEIEKFRPEHEGDYNCEVRNNNQILEKHQFSLKIGKPYFKTEPKNGYIIENRTHVIEFEVGGFPEPKIDYTYNGEGIEMRDFYFNRMSFNRSEKIEIRSMTQNDSGTFGIHVYNDHGFIYKVIYLDVQPLKPLNRTDEQTEFNVTDSKNVILKCPVDSFPPPKITWLKWDEEPKNIETNNHTTIFDDELSLKISDLTSEDVGVYQCNATMETAEFNGSVCVNLTLTRVESKVSNQINDKSQNDKNPWLLISIVVVIALASIGAGVYVYKKNAQSGVYHAAESIDIENQPGTSRSASRNGIATAHV